MARRRRDIVGRRGARHPPAADLDRLRRIAHVDAAVELVVVRVARLEVRRAGRHVHVFAVAEPQLMHAARMLARAVEEGDRARLLRHRDVEQLEPGRLLADLLRLVGDRHDVAGDVERVRAHMRLRQVGLHHDLRIARIGDVDAGEILRRAFVRQPGDAAAVLGELHRDAFAHAAEAAEIVLRQQLEIPGHGLAALVERIGGGRHSRLRSLGVIVKGTPARWSAGASFVAHTERASSRAARIAALTAGVIAFAMRNSPHRLFQEVLAEGLGPVGDRLDLLGGEQHLGMVLHVGIEIVGPGGTDLDPRQRLGKRVLRQLVALGGVERIDRVGDLIGLLLEVLGDVDPRLEIGDDRVGVLLDELRALPP